MAPILPTSLLKHHKWLKIQNSVYKLSAYILLKRDDMSPEFGKIQNIVYIDESKQILFLVEVYESGFFSTHYNAFSVHSTFVTQVIDVNSLEEYHPLLARRSYDISDQCLYISLPCTY